MTRVRQLVCSLLACALITGCHQQSGPLVDTWSAQLGEIYARWSAGPGVDLLRGVAVPVRGYMESLFLADRTGDIDVTYPGFSEAVPPDEPFDGRTDLGRDNRQPYTDYPRASPMIGNIEYRLRSIERTAGFVYAHLCQFSYGAAEARAGDYYVPFIEDSRTPSSGVIALRLSLVPPNDGSPDTLPPQEGPASAPAVDVFGGWTVDGLLTSAAPPNALWPTMDSDRAGCVADAPESVERRQFLTTGEHPRTDYPTLPPYPGWPAQR